MLELKLIIILELVLRNLAFTILSQVGLFHIVATIILILHEKQKSTTGITHRGQYLAHKCCFVAYFETFLYL